LMILCERSQSNHGVVAATCGIVVCQIISMYY
jgi:hypothetical protein